MKKLVKKLANWRMGRLARRVGALPNLRQTFQTSYFFIFAALTVSAAVAAPHRLWYRQSAQDDIFGWEHQSLPLGCGWFGVNVFGGVTNDWLQVTDNAVMTTCLEPYQVGNVCDALDIRFKTDHRVFSGYVRGLDLETATAWVEYVSDGVKYRRECFASYPARAMAVKFTASERGRLAFVLSASAPYQMPFGSRERAAIIGRTAESRATDGAISVYQHFESYDILFASELRLETDGKAVRDGDGAIRVTDATEATVYFACANNYRLSPRPFHEHDPKKKLDPIDPRPDARRLVEAAAAKGYDALRVEHLADYRALFGRVTLDLAADPSDCEIPTDELLGTYAKGGRSAWLEETYFQFGRYLLVSSSRPGTLPANLQGTWSGYRFAPWGCGYWHNINVQMNYWPAFSCNLAECFRAFADFNRAVCAGQRGAAVGFLKAHVPENVPAEDEARDMWTMGCAMWPYSAGGMPGGHTGPGGCGMTSKLYADWWSFTRDEEVLRAYAWPAIHGLAEFMTRCVVETNGLFLSKFSASPEQFDFSKPKNEKGRHPYVKALGCAFDQQMIWENSHDLIVLAKELGTNDAVVARAKAQIDRYDPVAVGASGQIKEFREETNYGDFGEYHHRHISQLMGVMPGTLVTHARPDWIAAAKVSLTERGDESTGWALAHRLNAWARLGDGDHAYLLLGNLLARRTYDNLWDAHPPFQIDGNFGAASGIAEMLLQSHAGFVELLPALPKAWAKKGAFRGLCARGGYEIDCAWREGRPVSVSVRKRKPGLPDPDLRFAGRPFVYWDMKRLSAKPAEFSVEGFEQTNGVKSVMIEGEQKTRIFCWYGLPKGASAASKVPGMVLVHGGGGTAFAHWVKTWNDRGYAAIAMDTCGGLPLDRKPLGHLRHRYSGPNGWGDFKSVGKPLSEQWTYHAVASVIRAHSFLAALPEVDAARIGLTGISWGGYLTSIVAAVDPRFVFAAPVYGCGYYGLHPRELWRREAGTDAQAWQKWLDLWDPSHFISGIACPVLWCAGTNDKFYPLAQLVPSYSLLTESAPLSLALRHKMPHGHPPAGDPPEIAAFAEHFLKGGLPLPRIVSAEQKGDVLTVRFDASGRKIVHAELLSTALEKPLFGDPDWTVTPVVGFDAATGELTIPIPKEARAFFVNLVTDTKLICSTRVFTVGG